MLNDKIVASRLLIMSSWAAMARIRNRWCVLCCQTPVAGFHQISNIVPTFVRGSIGPDIGTKVLCPLLALTTTQPTLETLKAILHISWSPQ